MNFENDGLKPFFDTPKRNDCLHYENLYSENGYKLCVSHGWQFRPESGLDKDKDGLLQRSEYMEFGCRGVQYTYIYVYINTHTYIHTF